MARYIHPGDADVEFLKYKKQVAREATESGLPLGHEYYYLRIEGARQYRDNLLKCVQNVEVNDQPK